MRVTVSLRRMTYTASSRFLDCISVASAITSIVCACLHAVLKSAYRSECVDVHFGPRGSVVHPTAISSIVAAALSLLANTTVVFKSRSKSKGALAVAAAIFSKWQPLCFIAVSLQKIVSRAIVMRNIATCPLNENYENLIEAATFMWDCTIFWTGVIAIVGDLEAEYAPTRRRCAYCFLAIWLLVDATGSYIWGNTLSGQVAVSLGVFEVFLENQLTSSITSQAIIAVHFLFVSCRSRSGRGWAYASLRFELDECGKASLPNPSLKEMDLTSKSTAASSTCAKTPMFESEEQTCALQNKAAEKLSFLSRWRQRIQRFQQRHLSRCRVFVIPCVADHDVLPGTVVGFAMARPAFDFRFLRPLQRLADAHPKTYMFVLVFFVGLPAIIVEVFLRDRFAQGVILVVLSFIMLTVLLGYLSSRRYGLDRIAAKHLVLSFRFASCVVLCAVHVALSARHAYLYGEHSWRAAAVAILSVVILECALIDCSPHTPASVQYFLTVTIAFCGVWFFMF
jgi:hypothetical protein